MSSFGMSKGLLEIGKFAVYVIVPIALTYAVTANSKNLQKIMGFHQYVVYPSDGPRTPSPEELREMARDDNNHLACGLTMMGWFVEILA